MADDPKPDTQAPDLGKLVEAALAKHGDQTSTLKAFAADLYAAKQDNDKLRAQLPKDGSLVLAGDDAKAWGAYTSLGRPADVRKVLDEHGSLAAENAALKRDTELRAVAEKAGVNPAVLKRLDDPSLVYGVTKARDKAGKDVEVVTVKAGDAAPEPLMEYAERTAPELMPALRPETRPAPERPNWTPSRADQTRHTRPEPASEESVKSHFLANGFASF